MTSQDLELVLYKIRTWSGLGLIILLGLQILTGYAMVAKVSIPLIPYALTYWVHTQFSWVTIYFILTHATVNLRFLFRRWWPKREGTLVPWLVAAYVFLTLATLYLQFIR